MIFLPPASVVIDAAGVQLVADRRPGPRAVPAVRQQFGPPPPPVSVSVDNGGVPDVVRSLSLAIGREHYSIAPGVLTNSRRLTLALEGPPDAVLEDARGALRDAGVDAVCSPSLCRFIPWEAPAPPPEPEKPKPEVQLAVLSYTPRFRDVGFLSGSLAGIASDWHFAGSSGGASGAAAQAVTATVGTAGGGGGSGGAVGGSARAVEAVPVRLVGVGPASGKARLLAALAELDRPVQSVVVHVAVYEVDLDKSDVGALSLVGRAASQVLTVGGSVASSVASAGLFTGTIKFGSFSAVVGALDDDSRVHLVTAPTLRTSSGVPASFAVGESVPTLGSVSYAQGSSTPVQSVTYQQDGVVFSVVPSVVGDHVDVALYQSISTFEATTVGVTTSPTLQNRVLSSDIIVQPGQVVGLGGLTQTSTTRDKSGWWIFGNITHDNEVVKKDLVLLLQVELAQEAGR